jgi:hypothetical protein
MDIQAICKRQAIAEGERSTWESHWDECLKVYSPRNRIINDSRTSFTTGEKKTENIYDSAPEIAAYKFASIIDGSLTPATQIWHKLRSSNRDLMKIGSVARWFDDVNNIMFANRYAPFTGFASQNNEAYFQLGVLGNGVLFTDEMMDRGTRYKSEHLYDIYLFENEYGIVDTVHKKFSLTARQAKGLFDDERLPSKIHEAAKDRPDQRFEFMHVIMPNDQYEPNKLGSQFKKYASLYIFLDDKTLVKRSGYNTFRYAIYRDQTAPRQVYAYSPGMRALADTKMLNQMGKTDIRIRQKMADPPLLVADNVTLRANIRPGAINVGGLDSQGRRMIDELTTNANISSTAEFMMQKRKAVEESFLVNLFNLANEKREMTATEILQRTREQGILVTPLGNRVQSEGLARVIEAEFDILATQKRLPPIPRELMEAQGEYQIEYDSPLSRAQKAEEALAITQVMQFEAQLGAVPTMSEAYNVDDMRRSYAMAMGLPARQILDEGEIAARQAARQQQQALMQMAQAAAPAAQAVKNLTEAQVMSNAG